MSYERAAKRIDTRKALGAAWEALQQAHAHLSGETPDETRMTKGEIEAQLLELIDDAISQIRPLVA